MAMDPIASAKRRTLELWIETGVVIAVGVLPPLVTSLTLIYLDGPVYSNPFLSQQLAMIVSEVRMAAVVLFVIWRSGESVSRFGLRKISILRDVFGGMALWAVLWVGNRGFWWGMSVVLSRPEYSALLHRQSTISYARPSDAADYGLLAISCSMVGLAEELVMRGFLIPRFEELLGSTFVSLILTTVLFACIHAYQGAAGVLSVAVFGFIQGAVFCLFRRLFPLALAHAAQDFIALGRHLP